MQARLRYARFPSMLVALFLAIGTALVLGGVLGYTLKSSALEPTTTRIIVERPGPAVAPSCIWVDGRKAC
jgi:hypothetical protein